MKCECGLQAKQEGYCQECFYDNYHKVRTKRALRLLEGEMKMIEVELCPHCNKNEVNIDDYGCVTCFDCLDAHPEWKKVLNKCAYEESLLR